MKGLLLLLIALPASAQESAVFPRFSILAGRYSPEFTTDVRVDPDGTNINLERDLGLDRSQHVNDFAVRWRPLPRHELAGSYVSVSRNGAQTLTAPIRFNGRLYPTSVQATTTFDTKRWEGEGADARSAGWKARATRGRTGDVSRVAQAFQPAPR